MKRKDKAVSIGWVSRWEDGKIGWMAPPFIYDERRPMERPYYFEEHLVTSEETFYRCRITVELLPDKNGNPVSRKFRGKNDTI